MAEKIPDPSSLFWPMDPEVQFAYPYNFSAAAAILGDSAGPNPDNKFLHELFFFLFYKGSPTTSGASLSR